jgi:adenine nucleotide transporter 17
LHELTGGPSFLYFYVYALLRAFALRKRAHAAGKAAVQTLSVAIELALGFVAGVASRAVSTPLSVITVRLQTEGDGDDEEKEKPALKAKKARPLQVLQRIYDADGLAGFWKGLSWSYLVSCTILTASAGFASTVILSLNPALTFAFFQLAHRAVARLSRSSTSNKPGPAEAFFGAASSNALAVLLLYPLILAKTRMQAGVGTLAHVLRHAYADEGHGLSGIYQGLQAQLLKGFVNQGVSFLAKER